MNSICHQLHLCIASIKLFWYIKLENNPVNQFESGRIRFTEKRNSSSGFQGGYIHYDGSANALYLGVHETPDTTVGNDVNFCMAMSTSFGQDYAAHNQIYVLFRLYNNYMVIVT